MHWTPFFNLVNSGSTQKLKILIGKISDFTFVKGYKITKNNNFRVRNYEKFRISGLKLRTILNLGYETAKKKISGYETTYQFKCKTDTKCATTISKKLTYFLQNNKFIPNKIPNSQVQQQSTFFRQVSSQVIIMNFHDLWLKFIEKKKRMSQK